MIITDEMVERTARAIRAHTRALIGKAENHGPIQQNYLKVARAGRAAALKTAGIETEG